MKAPRRRTRPVLWLLVVGVLAAVLPGALGAPPARADGFAPPAAAYTRPLGGAPQSAPCTINQNGDGRCYPAGGVPVEGGFANGLPASQPGLGVPMGGIGAGSFMVNQSGTFGPWNFGGSRAPAHYENRILPQAAFHVREEVGDEAAYTRTLAAPGPWGSVLPAWDALKEGEGTYSALFPFGWTRYTPFAQDVSMRFWSPLVAGEDERTSMPVAYFDVEVANRTDQRSTTSVMFTMPNAPIHVDTTPVSVRKGFTSRFERDAATGVQGVTLAADHADNTADTQGSEWTLAVRPSRDQRVSHTTSWDAEGDGADVYADFVRRGRLPDAPLDRSASAGALSVEVDLEPGETTTVRYALAWDFPQSAWGPADDSVWMKRYTEFFGARTTSQNDYVAGSYPGHQGFEIAERALVAHSASLRDVRAWWDPVALDPDRPAWLRMAALNELFQLTFNGSFWENGLVRTSVETAEPRIGSAVPGTHLFHLSTSGGWADATEWDVESHSWLSTARLFPNVERGRLLGRLQMIAQDPVGDAPNAAGGTHGSPWLEWQPTPLTKETDTQFFDIPHKDVFRAYAHHRMTGDDAFLRYAYPSMKKTLDWVRTHVTPGRALPRDYPGQSSTYDVIEVVGHGAYNSQLYLLSLTVMVDATRKAMALGVPEATPELLATYRSDLVRAKAEYEQLFWDPVRQHYKIDAVGSYGGAVFADAFYAQLVATQLGLPDLIDTGRMTQHLQTAFPMLMQVKDEDGHYVGPPVAVADVLGKGVVFRSPAKIQVVPEAAEVWPGGAWFVAAQYYTAGRRFGSEELREDGLLIGRELKHQVWDNVSNGFAFGTPEGWIADDTHGYRSPGYVRNRSVWSLLEAVEPVRQPRFHPTAPPGAVRRP